MPTVSESLAKRSASMAELSQRAKEAEDHMAAARKETHEQLETRVAEVWATAQRRREEMKTRGIKVNDQLASPIETWW
jgi:cysteinyl-tRNA synthetase